MRRPVTLSVLFVAFVAFVAHARALGHGFVYDDHRFVEHNDAIASLGDVAAFFSDPATASAAEGVEPDIWRPLRTLVFAVDRALFGLSPFGWHLGSLALHVLNAVLVFVFLLRRLGPRDGGAGRVPRAGQGWDAGVFAAAAGAALFAVHPVVTESVAWVSSRGDLLAWTCVLLALEAFARPSLRATAVGVLLGVLACLAKESAVVLFLLVPIAHLSLPSASRPGGALVAWRTGALAVVTGLYLVARSAVLPGAGDLPWLAQIGWPDDGRAGAARGFLAAVAWYARVLVLPTGFPFDRNAHTDPVPASFLDPDVVLGAAILSTLLVVGGLAVRRGRPVLATAFLGAVVALGPVSNVIVPLKAFAAERFLYPVLPFLALGAGAGVAGLAARTRRGVALGVVGAAVLGLVALAFVRSGPWRDEASLWRAVVAQEPMNPRAWEGLGFGHLTAGRVGEAERAFRTVREFQPDDGKVRAELAAAFHRAASDLVPADPGAYEGTDLAARRRFALSQTIEECRAAWRIWSRVGLERGRGDTALVRATLRGWLGAAIEFGDLEEAARVLVFLGDEERRRTGALSFDLRRVPALLAALALTGRASGGGGADPARDRVRASRLEAVGVAPALADVDAAGAVAERLGLLLAERPDDHELRRFRSRLLGMRVLGSRVAPSRGDLETLKADLAILVRAFPRDRASREALEALEGRGRR